MHPDQSELTKTAEIARVLKLAGEGRSVLVTGRAGTGKSTLLRQVRTTLDDSGKVVSLVAPTGIAALNVGGETLHRHFAFRADLLSSLRNYRPPAHLLDTDVLIIDEISMVRADYFDMMSRALMRAKDNREPFGGCQVILFGDLFQLPPVVTDRDRAALTGYQSPFFFSSDAFASTAFESVELTTIFRQKGDDAFIALLNSVRESINIAETLEALNSRVLGDAGTVSGAQVSLVPSNRRANEINREKLLSLGNPVFEWQAEVHGEISLTDYKVDRTLQFAVGAQVMMATNTSEFVNGTMGIITDIEFGETVSVTIEVGEPENRRLVTVGPHKWEVWRRTREEALLVGSVEQLPFRLAWAVTIHRSQGQTFERIVFDRDRGMFADGQLYVALSRCRTLEGLTLSRPLTERDVQVNADVLRFYRSLEAPSATVAHQKHAFIGFLETGNDEYGRLLEIAIHAFDGDREAFRFSTLVNPMRDFEHVEAQLTPESVTLAPAIDNIRAAVATMLGGRIVVGHRCNRLQDLLALDDFAAEGLWVDVDVFGEPKAAESSEASAVSTLERIKHQFTEHGETQQHRVVPVGEVDTSIPSGLFFFDRSDFTSSPDDVASQSSGANASRLRAAVLAGALGSGEPTLRRHLQSVSVDELSSSMRDVLEALLASGLRDGRISPHERAGIELLASSFGLPVPGMPEGNESVEVPKVFPGQRVCLTGEGLNKPYVRGLLSDFGLREIDRVTKSGCDLVVAQSSSSQSRKAKAARGFGIPVISLDQLESLLKQEFEGKTESSRGAAQPAKGKVERNPRKSAEQERAAQELFPFPKRRLPRAIPQAIIDACEDCGPYHEAFYYCEAHRSQAIRNTILAARKNPGIISLHMMMAEKGLDIVS